MRRNGAIYRTLRIRPGAPGLNFAQHGQALRLRSGQASCPSYILFFRFVSYGCAKTIYIHLLWGEGVKRQGLFIDY